MRTVNIYNPFNNELIGKYKVRNIYEDIFYHRPMPTLGSKICKQILSNMYPHFKADNVPMLFEWDDTKYKGLQSLYRNGTVLNF